MNLKELIEREPLVRFSVYTSIHAQTVRTLGAEIISALNADPGSVAVVDSRQGGSYGKLWLWVLGAYETIRTMCQAHSCFSENANERLSAYKKRIAVLRMPFAKQEFAGRVRPIQNEASIAGVALDKRDAMFKVQGDVISVRDLIEDFDRLIAGLTVDDILKDHRQHAAPRPAS